MPELNPFVNEKMRQELAAAQQRADAAEAQVRELQAIAQAAEDFYQAERQYDAALAALMQSGDDDTTLDYGDLFSARAKLFGLLHKRRAALARLGTEPQKETTMDLGHWIDTHDPRDATEKLLPQPPAPQAAGAYRVGAWDDEPTVFDSEGNRVATCDLNSDAERIAAALNAQEQQAVGPYRVEVSDAGGYAMLSEPFVVRDRDGEAVAYCKTQAQADTAADALNAMEKIP